jgi:HEAT repeat protein
MRKVIGLGLGMLLVSLCLTSPVGAQNKKAAGLIKELADKNPKVRAAAADDLGNLAELRLADAKSALPALREAQKDTDPNVRKAVLEALGKIESENYGTLLQDSLKKDTDPVVQLAAVNALGQLMPPLKAAVPVLIEVYKASPQDAPKTAKAPPPPPPGTPPPADPPAVRRAILGALARLEPDPKGRIPFLIESLQQEKDLGVRVTLVTTLGQVGPPAKEAVPVLLEVQKASLQEALKPPPPKQQKELDPQGLRRAILTALGRIQSEPKVYVPILMDAVKNDKDAAVRTAAVTALAQIGPPAKEAVPALLDAQKTATAANDPQGALRKAIVSALGKIETEPKDRIALYIELLKREKDPATRLVAVTALGEIGPPAKAAIPVLLDVQKSSPPMPKVTDPQGVRKAVLEALAKIEADPKDFVPLLIDAAKKDRDTAVRSTAVKTLGQLGPAAKAAIPALTDLQKLAKTAKEEDKALAKEAEAALEKIQSK